MTPESSAAARPASRWSPWVVAIVVGLALVAIANGAFIYIAVSGADPVVPSYVTEPR